MARVFAWLAADAAIYRARTEMDVGADDIAGSGGVYKFSICVVAVDWYYACD